MPRMRRRGAPAREETVVIPDWVMLDRRGRTDCHDTYAAASEAASKGNAAVSFETACYHSCYISFTVADPPKVSYVNLHWPNRPAKPVFTKLPAYSYVLAADKNSFLLRISVPSQSRCNKISSGLFVYTVGPSPSVLRLPECADTAASGTSLSKFTLGILGLAGSPGHYIVSDLNVSTSRRNDNSGNNAIVSKLCLYSSKREKWEVVHMSSLRLHAQSNGQFPNLWSTDDVLPFDGRFLCWVDYFSGILLADFSKRDNSALHFVPFPGKKYSDEVRVSRLCPGRFQRVSISKGVMQFVHIDNDWHETLQFNYDWDHIDWPERSQGQPHGSKITIRTLNMVGKGKDIKFDWEVRHVINLDSLWAQPSYQDKHMPQCLPEFPFVAVNDPDVLCCLVREEGYLGKAWMIMVDMKCACVWSWIPYINEQPCFAEGTGLEARRSTFSDVPLLPSFFSRGLKMPAGIPCVKDKDKLPTRPSKKGKLVM